MESRAWPPKPYGWEDLEIPARTASSRWPLPDILWATCPEHGRSAFVLLFALNVYACTGGSCSFGMVVDSIQEDGGEVAKHGDWPWSERVYYRNVVQNVVLDKVQSGADSARG